MKKTFYFLVALLIAVCVGRFVSDAWESTAYVKNAGRDGTLVVGQRYNASRWAEPLPLKKIHTYTATLAPKYNVVIESDQELVEGRQYFIRFLRRDQAAEAPATYARPLPGSIRLRTADDGSPVKIDAIALMDHVVAESLGSLGPGHDPIKVAPRAVPGQQRGAVPFLLGGAEDNLLELVWANSQISEWVVLTLALLLLQHVFFHAYGLPWRTSIPRSERKDFVHPSMQAIDPDPAPKPPSRLTLKTESTSPETASNPPPEAKPYTEPVLKLPRK